MIESTLKSKSPLELFDQEDILTSTFFGSLQFLPDNEIWSEIFARSKGINNLKLRDELVKELNEDIKSYSYELFFWEYFEDYGEPDLILKLTSDTDSKSIFLIIEVKLWSLKSNSGDYNDQLIKYIDLLESAEFDKRFSLQENKIHKAGLIYLTPRSRLTEIKDSLDSINNYGDYSSKLFGLRWQDIFKILNQVELKEQNIMYDKLANLIEKIGLTPFDGLSKEVDIDDDIYDKYIGYSKSLNFTGFTYKHLDYFKNLKRGYNKESE